MAVWHAVSSDPLFTSLLPIEQLSAVPTQLWRLIHGVRTLIEPRSSLAATAKPRQRRQRFLSLIVWAIPSVRLLGLGQ